MQNVADIYTAWPSDAELARDLAVPYPTISAWKQRGSIPAAYWWDITSAARGRGHPEITADLLARLHARKPVSETPANNGEASGLEEQPMNHYSATAPDETQNVGNGVAKAGHFSRFKHVRRENFASAEEITEHISALRDEWERR
jgi:hypothetical protein